MSDRVSHWRRPLKDGRVEFFMAAGGQTLSGSGTVDAYRVLRGIFEEATGVKLPLADVKQPRGTLRLDAGQRTA